MQARQIIKHIGGPIAMLSLPVPGRDHIKGSAHAPVRLLQYGDYACAHSAAMYAAIKTLHEQMGEGLCYAFRHCLSGDSGIRRSHAAEAAEAADSQGKFWEMHDLLFKNQAALADEDLARYAQELRLNVTRAMREVLNGSHALRVQQDILAGRGIGVTGSPALFVNGQRCDGLMGLSCPVEDAPKRAALFTHRPSTLARREKVLV